MVLLAAALALASLRYLLARPLRRLVRQMSAVADGEYRTPIDAAGTREVASIARAAEQMRAGLVRYSEDVVAAQDQLSITFERDRLAAELQP